MARTRLVASAAASAACAAAALMGCCLALLAVTVPSALASARPGTPDEFLGLLLWAQAASERAAAASAPADAVEAVEAAVAAAPPPPPPNTARQLAVDWRDKHRALFRKASESGASADGGSGLPPKKAQSAAKKHAPAPKTTISTAPARTPATATAPTPVTSTSTATAVPAPALWAPEESVSRAAMPALEEYDRSERFGHSFVHGFRPF